jgi:acrylyl-CoA reductase (NADPH)
MIERLSFFGRRPVPPLPAFGSDQFYQGLSDGHLFGQRCGACGLVTLPPVIACGKCGKGDFEIAELDVAGTLFSFTVVHAAPGALTRQAPYTIGLVDLESGVRILCRLFGRSGEPFAVGIPMILFVADYEDGPVLAARSATTPLENLHYEPRVTMSDENKQAFDSFRALVADKRNGEYGATFRTVPMKALPEDDVIVRVKASSLNYKDALAITGRAPICKSFPMVLGIDLAGTVVESRTPKFRPGNDIIVTGYGMSETRWGGLSEYQSLPESIVMHRPSGFSEVEAMLIGTAGYTAMLCVMALEEHGLQPEDGALLITGATGGVGSIALSLLAKAGYRTIAVTSRPEQAAFLKSLGATDIISRNEVTAGGKGIGRERWAGAIDVVGGQMLADVLAQTRYDGIVACCGMAGGGGLPASVYPFILRGITLKGVDSVMAKMSHRIAAWSRLDKELDRALLQTIGEVRPFDEVIDLAHSLLDGKLRGRIAIDMTPSQPASS